MLFTHKTEGRVTHIFHGCQQQGKIS
jgi:hypothetical protein